MFGYVLPPLELLPEEEQRRVLAFIAGLDIKAIAAEVMQKLFTMLEIKFDFSLTKTEVTQ